MGVKFSYPFIGKKNDSLQQLEKLENKLMEVKNIDSSIKEDHKFYGYLIGKINSIEELSNYDISDPECEILLKKSTFDIQNASTCFQEKSLRLFFNKKYTSQDIYDAIKSYSSEGSKYLNEYVQKAALNVPLFRKRYDVNEDQAFGCCLALSYYTGSGSERFNRGSNIIIKLHGINVLSKIKGTPQYEAERCISHWLFKALNGIPLHWGLVTRCVQLKDQQYELYKPGNIVTWLQFSSSSHGPVTQYFADRNTRFIIYSLSGRCIDDFSNYKGVESEVLFKPFSHFMVLKIKKQENITYIYMRQIFIGQSDKNVLWVDDNIFDQTWPNKIYMQEAIIKNPLLSIVPKVSTECALAFLNSQIGRNRDINEFRIISDMNRNNQNPSNNAGARLIQACKKLGLKYKMLIFTSDKEKAEQELSSLNAKMDNVNVSVCQQDALKFLSFES